MDFPKRILIKVSKTRYVIGIFESAIYGAPKSGEVTPLYPTYLQDSKPMPFLEAKATLEKWEIVYV